MVKLVRINSLRVQTSRIADHNLAISKLVVGACLKVNLCEYLQICVPPKPSYGWNQIRLVQNSVIETCLIMALCGDGVY